MKILLLTLALSACMLSVEGSVLLSPIPDDYPQWWMEVGQCLEREKNFFDVEYYVVPGAITFPCPGGNCYAIHQHGRITVAGERVYDVLTIKHEMIHAYGVDHPGDSFINPNVVPCQLNGVTSTQIQMVLAPLPLYLMMKDLTHVHQG